MGKRLIYCAFASKEGFKGSENLSGQANSLQIYLQNACVCCFTAKKHNPDCDVAFVHNLKTIPEEFVAFFDKYNILSIYVEYSDFVFPPDYKWSLAFYKLCALQYFAEKSSYESIVSLDVDTYSIGSLEPCFTLMKDRLVLYNVQHSYDLDAYRRRLEEYSQLYKSDAIPTVYGGEFIAGNKQQMQKFLQECQKVYNLLQEKDFKTSFGDEFITFCAAEKYPDKIADAAPYIRRYWTTDLYYQCFTDHALALRVVHVPNEKNNAFVRLYRHILRVGDVPKNEEVFKMMGFPTARRPKYWCNIVYQFKRKVKKLFWGN